MYEDIDKLRKWFEWMTGDDDSLVTELGEITIKSPKLSKNKAFDILYTLQEYLRVISCEFEMCRKCKFLGTMSDGSVDNIDREEYVEQGFKRKPRKGEEGIYCEDCLRDKFGFR